jgi:penicillin-binding protein 1B
MTIEITSILEPKSLFRTLLQPLRALFAAFTVGRHRILFRFIALTLLITSGAAAVSLVQSYRFYSRIIDARLASGYLTSRPGIYAAPRSISVGERLSRDSLVAALRRAGYVEVPESVGDPSNASEIWSGSFQASGNKIEIHPGRTQVFGPSIVQVALDGSGRVTELTGDGVTLDSFALEPEVLTSDLLSKTGQRTQLTYNQIPPVLVHAILSIEDRRFFEHTGLDLFGVFRALLRNAGDERIGQGGSTITQQLVKNTYLSSERTLRRKFAEAMLSVALERRLSKEDILALYCNEVYLGQRGAVAIRGVEQAARIYFGKDVKDLSLAEAAALAGMIQGPTHYSPDRHADAAKVRRNTVLGTMVRDRWINLDQAADASKEPVAVVPVTDTNKSVAPYFIDYVNRVAESQTENAGGDEQGERIYTTIDLDLQQFAEAAIKRQLERLDQVYKDRDAKPQAALVALDPQTGKVLAMVGGRSYAESQLNRAVDARRQPGSTFKPFVYAAALESGISPVQMFTDAPREFVYDRNRVYRPANYGGGYSMSDVTMRAGLVKSLNVVTVDIAMQTGLARIANLTERFGLPKPERYPALALGTTEVTPLQLAAAYATFANGGRRVEPRVIESVNELPGAHTLDSNSKDLQVINPATAYMITNMLAAVIDHGTGRAARGAVKGTAVAGKTGTSRDGWFVGFTPNLVCAVWIGFDDNQQLGLTGAAAALPAWAEFMNGAVALRPELGGRTFACPEGIKFVEIDNATGLLSTVSCPNRELIAITDALAPNTECYRHGNIRELLEANKDGTSAMSDSSAPATSRARKKEITNTGQHTPLLGTRIDVDARGRRTLVNEMR